MPQTSSPVIEIAGRRIGPDYAPLVIAEIGINHEGRLDKALQMVDDAAAAGCECAKFQCHVIEDEMIPNNVIPGNATESIWDIMARCRLTDEEDRYLKQYVEQKGMMYLSTPFSRAAADRLEAMGVDGYKIGSGECNNIPLLEHIASFGKPVILSTGMNDLASVHRSAAVFQQRGIPFALLQCTSMYPTPYNQVHLGALADLASAFPEAPVGLSDHSIGIWTCLGAAALGASILEKHFTSDMSWPGPDIPISIDPRELRDMIVGSAAIQKARGGGKNILDGEAPTIAFAYACVVTTREVAAGEVLDKSNVWVKRPGTGEILARELPRVLGSHATSSIPAHTQLRWTDFRAAA